MVEIYVRILEVIEFHDLSLLNSSPNKFHYQASKFITPVYKPMKT